MTTTTTIAGNLTRDPEIRYLRDGQATTSLSVATNRRFTTPGQRRVAGDHLLLRRRRMSPPTWWGFG